MNEWHTKILATQEEAQETSRSGKKLLPIGSDGKPHFDFFFGVALPSVKAKGRWIKIRYGDRMCCALADDVGPWAEDDDPYVFDGARPRAEQLKGQPMTTTVDGTQSASVPDGNGGFRPVEKSNGGGIDLYPAVVAFLGIPKDENVFVDWAFVEAL